MKNDRGWDKYGPDTFGGSGVRMTLLSEVLMFVTIKLANDKKPKAEDFDGSMKDAVTEEELNLLIAAFKVFAQRWLQFEQPRPNLLGNFRKLYEPWAKLDLQDVLVQIKDFDFATLN